MTLSHRIFSSYAFTRTLMKRKTAGKQAVADYDNDLVLRVNAVVVEPCYSLAIIGNCAELGSWNESKALVMNDFFPEYSIALNSHRLAFPLEYKYVIYDPANHRVVEWEEGENRVIRTADNLPRVHQDREFRHSKAWKAAGTAIPVFSLRSENGFGVGEFPDLIRLIDWAKATGQRLIQLLPINDTTKTFGAGDSYPYDAITTFGLHPIYLNIEKMGEFSNRKIRMMYEKFKQELNQLPELDYPLVMERKWLFFQYLYRKYKNTLNDDTDYLRFVADNKSWLLPYAAFCQLRDEYRSTDFTNWGEDRHYYAEEVGKNSPRHDKNGQTIGFYVYLQYHADKQLREASLYARKQGVALKGDLPIGVDKHSVETWVNPALFNLNGQAGAPPDDFSDIGQNWGFPTYHWDNQRKDDFAWWKARLSKMSDFFDAYRIDHVLGFFRIWEVPAGALWGLLGYFNPALPLSAKEIQAQGIPFDAETYTIPSFTQEHLFAFFDDETDWVKETFLELNDQNRYVFSAKFDTQEKTQIYFQNYFPERKQLLNKLLSLYGEVLFIADPYEAERYHPRILIHTSVAFQLLDDKVKEKLNALYNDYFYVRHNEFWKQEGLKKLPAVNSSTSMLCCAEDLGMIPDCVPEVLREQEILTLEIERMPKQSGVEFADLATIPYYSVCTTSTHDMSPLRLWWEEDFDRSQRYFNDVLKIWGEAPFRCQTWICEQIILNHLLSPAMWVVLPWQDWLSIDEDLRSTDIRSERINIPSNPTHVWNYRMHLTLEELLQADKLNRQIRAMIEQTGRYPK